MAKGMPKDTLFKTTAKKSLKQKVTKSASKQVPATTRQTYYVPLDLHKRMKILSIQREREPLRVDGRGRGECPEEIHGVRERT